MRITNKLHRVTAILAAVFMIFTTIFSVISLVRTLRNVADGGFALILSVVGPGVVNLIISVLFIIMLFRGKKDTAAGIVFILSTIAMLVTGVFSRVSAVITYATMLSMYAVAGSMIVGNVIGLLSALIGVVFRAAIAVECFNPGKLSAGKAKAILIVLPIVVVILTVASTMATSVMPYIDRMGIAEIIAYVAGNVFAQILSSIPMILMGVAFAIPVKEYVYSEYGYQY